MARYISSTQDQAQIQDINTSVLRPLGFLGIFGNGFWYYETGAGSSTSNKNFDFTVKQNSTGFVRIRAVGRGGDGDLGGGGGYCHGTFGVSPGDLLSVSIDSTSSRVLLGGVTLLEAFAGGDGTNASGGSATGGDFQASGADGGLSYAGFVGGGASGSQLGQPFGAIIPSTIYGDYNQALVRFPFDGFGSSTETAGSVAADYGNGAITNSPAGIGGGGNSSTDPNYGSGIVIIEW